MNAARRIGRACLGAALGALLCCLSGCAALVVYTTSLPEAPGATPVHVDRGGFAYLSMGTPDGARLESEALDLTLVSRRAPVRPYPAAFGPVLPILPVPYDWWPDEGPSSFHLELRLEPNEPLSVSPRQIGLRLPDGTEIRSSGFMGPLVPEGTGRFYDAAPSTSAVFVPAGRTSCFVVRFEHDAPLPWEFSVDVRGIERSDQPVSLPRVDFRQGTLWYVFWGGGDLFCAE